MSTQSTRRKIYFTIANKCEALAVQIEECAKTSGKDFEVKCADQLVAWQKCNTEREERIEHLIKETEKNPNFDNEIEQEFERLKATEATKT